MTANVPATLIRLSEISNDPQYNLNDTALYNPVGHTAYGFDGEKVGSIRDALVDGTTGRMRFFLVDVGGWFSSKLVMVPVGHARIEDSGVYFDHLTREQVKQMGEYKEGEVYAEENLEADVRVLRGNEDEHTYAEHAYKTPDRLQLLEERLVVNKDRFTAGSVQIGKRLETRQETVDVALRHEEVVIERRPVADARPVEGAVLGSDHTTLSVDLEAERANVSKQAYVTEEVSVGKREVSETQRVTETVGREVLEVNKTGDVKLEDEKAKI